MSQIILVMNYVFGMSMRILAIFFILHIVYVIYHCFWKQKLLCIINENPKILHITGGYSVKCRSDPISYVLLSCLRYLLLQIDRLY